LPDGAALAAPWELDPGAHALLVEAAGAAPVARSFYVRNGEALTLSVALTAAPPRDGPAARGGVPPGAYVAGAAGALALGAGALLGLKGHLEVASLRDRCAPFCDRRDVDAVVTEWTVGAALAGVGTLALGAALWLAWAGPGGAPSAGRAAGPGRGPLGPGPLLHF
jgi:hypothetical protein